MPGSGAGLRHKRFMGGGALPADSVQHLEFSAIALHARHIRGSISAVALPGRPAARSQIDREHVLYVQYVLLRCKLSSVMAEYVLLRCTMQGTSGPYGPDCGVSASVRQQRCFFRYVRAFFPIVHNPGEFCCCSCLSYGWGNLEECRKTVQKKFPEHKLSTKWSIAA
eukprot:gene12024-biopygen1876